MPVVRTCDVEARCRGFLTLACWKSPLNIYVLPDLSAAVRHQENFRGVTLDRGALVRGLAR